MGKIFEKISVLFWSMMIIGDFRAKARWLYGDDATKSVIRAFCSDASLSMLLYRGMTFLNKYLITRPLAAVLCKLNAIVCGVVIGRGASFGKEFVILHSVGVVINSKVCGGRNIILESGVVIGEEKRGCPTLGSNIFIGSGAKIFGAITLGDNITIGANAVVNKSFPKNVVVGGIPAKIIRYKEVTETI
jgi:serine O-acetyltransferase